MDIRALVDDLLEVSVVGSFSSQGYRVRSRLWGWDPLPELALAGRTALITGPTSGIGRETAHQLAGLGARLALLGRSADRLAAVRDELVARHGEDRFATVVADLSSLSSVRRAVDEIKRREERLDLLIDNAGGMFHERRESEDGIELSLATMVVGPFALVSGLLPLLRAGGGARVISVTSGGMYAQPLQLEDLQFEGPGYSGPKAYARAKRAQVALMREWARREASAGIRFNSMHPGWVDTPGLAEMLPGFYSLTRPLLRSDQQGADTIVWLAADPDAADLTGRLFHDRRPRPFDRVPQTRVSPAERRRLWQMVAELVGVGAAEGDVKSGG